MENTPRIGCITRSKARASAGNVEPTGDSTLVAASPRSVSSRSRFSRSSREALRLRAEYEAEKQIIELKEQLIKKKLELNIAEIEDVEDRGTRSMSGSEKVEEWLFTEQGSYKPPAEHAAEPSAKSPRATSLNRFIPVARRVTAIPPQPAATAIASVATENPPPPTANASDILQLADVIITNMKKRKPEQNYDLPIFDGDPAKWLSYKRAYENTARTYEYENTVRLQVSLRGAAKYAVEDLLSTGSDPEDIIRSLEEEFGHPNLLLDNALEKIRRLPRVSESGAELRHMTSAVRNCLYVLKNIKAEGYINNPQLTHEILNKLTPVQRLQYGEYVMKTSTDQGEDLRISPNLNIVLEFLSHLSKASIYCLPVNKLHTNRNHIPAATMASESLRYRHRGTHRVHASVDVPEQSSPPVSSSRWAAREPPCSSMCSSASTRSRTRRGCQAAAASHRTVTANITCALCNSDHLLPECAVFASKNEGERWDIVKANKLCFKCLVQQHSRYQCREKRCAKCRSPHHTLLHFEKPGAAASVAPAPAGAALALSPPPSGPAAVPGNHPPATGVSAESVTSMG